MARNLGRAFATMSEEERRRFELERASAPDSETAAEELDLDEPRNADQMGRHYPSQAAEVADRDARDGEAALLDDKAHERHLKAREHRGKR